jgi:hypothetical protein
MVTSILSKVLLAVALAYLVAIAMLYVVGKDGIAAGLLALPGSYLVFTSVEWIPHDSLLGLSLTSWTGNLLLILLSAALNLAAVYIGVRLVSKP